MKTLIPRLAAATILVAALALTAPAAESLSVLLQKGIYAEETEGNLDSAIKIYEQIAADSATNRAVVAQAQYRLAVCYQKKGNKEQAIKLLNGLVQQPLLDASVTKKARDTLVEMGATPANNRTIRKISFPVASDWFISISPDGRFVAYKPEGTEHLAVCELATGKSSVVFKGTKENLYWAFALISPDNQWIAYRIAYTANAAMVVSKVDGSESRTLYQHGSGAEWMNIASWSPDGTKIFVSSRVGDGPSSVFALDTKTGAKTEIAKIPGGETPNFYSLSSDGMFAARRVGSFPRRILLRDLQSGDEETVLERDAGDFVALIANDSKLVFTKASAHGNELWAVNVKEGKLAGQPVLLLGNLGSGSIKSFGATNDGNIYYHIRDGKDHSYWVMEGFLATKPAVPPAESWRIQTDIPTEELILGPDNSILDRKFGFAATLPSAWTVRSAVRQGNGGSVLSVNSSEIGEAQAQPRIIYWPTTPWENPGSPANDFAAVGPRPTTPAEIDAWLHNWIKAVIKENAENDGYPHYKATSAAKTTVINGHRAVTIAASYTRGGKPWVQLITTVYSEKMIAYCDWKVPAEKLEQIQPAFERLVETIRLP